MTDDSAATIAEQELGARLASKVARLRERHNLSLDSLAERAGLSKGTVVGIARGSANPSIGVLCRLAAALSVSVSDLIEPTLDDGLRPAAQQTEPRTLWSTPAGSEATLLAALSGSIMFELWSWSLAPGEMHLSEAHSVDTAELISVQRGHLEITVGADVIHLKAGEAARLRTDREHAYRGIGRGRTTFTMAVLERGGGHQQRVPSLKRYDRHAPGARSKRLPGLR